MIDNRLVRIFFLLGRILSSGYSVVMKMRALLYGKGFFSSTRLSLPVVSVGNLTMGGTGKTPMVIYLARLLSRHGLRPGIVSRGYGGRNRLPVALVSDGVQLLLSPKEAGDEPVLLARQLPGVSIVISRKRVEGGEYLAKKGMADVVILDDGFQHQALRRDLDLVLFASGVRVFEDWVFPGGMLREPPSALNRADCCVVTGGAGRGKESDEFLLRWLDKVCPDVAVFSGEYQPVALYDQKQRVVPFADLAGVPLFAFCGIANPLAFRRTLEGLFWIKGWKVFADHYPYVSEDIEILVRMAAVEHCAALITTEKDYVKIKSMELKAPIWILAVELRMEDDFDRFVLKKLALG